MQWFFDAVRLIVREEIARALTTMQPTRGRGVVADNEYLSQNDAAVYCGVTTATIRNWHADGLRVHRTGRVVRYRREDLNAFMARNTARDPAAWVAETLARNSEKTPRG